MKRALATVTMVVATALTSCASLKESESAGLGDGGGGRDATAGSADSGSISPGIPGTDGSCETCDAGCSNGLVTVCLVLFCGGSQPSTSFCPYGCSPDAPGGCNFDPIDGAVAPGCIASSATIQQGVLQGQGAGTPVAVTWEPSNERVIIATSASAACAVEGGDAGPSATGNGATLTFVVSGSAEETFSSSGAQLTVWKDGGVVINGASASSGSVWVNLVQPGEGGGTIGGYDLTFGSDVEQGAFVAPACDICAGGP